MRVLRIYHSALEPGHGERDAALARAGVELVLAAPRAWPGATARRPGVHLFDVNRAGDVNRHSYADPGVVAKLADDYAVDLVDIHEEPFSAVTRQLLAALPSRLPVVAYTAQNIDKRWPPPFHQWQQAAFAAIAGLYPCSRQAASVARGAGFAGIITPLPLGTDPEVFHPGAQEHEDTEFTLGLVGRLVPEKGVTDAVKVLAQLHLRRPTRLVIVGEGPERGTALELAASRGVAAQLTLAGWQTPSALADRYRGLHAVLVPSTATRTWVEQFGRVVTEGRACGAVPVGYASGSLPEVIDATGLTVAEGDVEALTRACERLAADAAHWRRLRARSVAATTTWDDVASGQAALYERVLDAGGHSRHVGAGGHVGTGRQGGTGRHSRDARRPAAVVEFGAPAVIAGGGRPFALPVLRSDAAPARGLASAIDLGARVRCRLALSPGERAIERLLLATVRLPGGSDVTATPDASDVTATPGGSDVTAIPGGSDVTATPGSSDVAAALLAASRLVDPDRVLAAAREHGVAPLLAEALRAAGDCWPALTRAIRPHTLGQVGQAMVQAEECAAAAEGLLAAGIPYAVVKGPVLAGHAYGSLERRAFADLDVLVGHQDVLAAAAAIGASGISAASVAGAAARGAGQISGQLPRGTSLDLHWELINDPAVRRDFSLPTVPLLSRRRTVSLEGRAVSTLDATDTLLHLASHTAVSGGHRLLWYVDLDRVVRTDGIDAAALLARARAAGLSTTLGVLLRRCDRQLGTPAPPGLIGALLGDGSRGWGSLARLLDGVPLSASPDRPAHGQIYFRATRQSLRASLRAALTLAAEVHRTRPAAV